MSRRFASFAFLGVATLLASLSVACGSAAVGGEDPAAQGVDVTVEPSQTAVTSRGSTQFAAAVTGTSVLSVKWVVDESGGGSVDSTGLYVAPATAGIFHVRAVSVADSSVSAAAQVTVTAGGGSSSGGSSSGGSSSGGSSSGGSTTASCASAPLRTTGTVYYYCDCQSGATSGCIAGSDSNTGTSASMPRRSFSDAVSRFNSLRAGDTVAFCRGGSWTSANGYFTNTQCTASSPCDFRDYTPAGMSSSTPRPIFAAGTNDFVSATQSGTRTGYRFWNLDVRQSGYSGNTFNLGSSNNDMDICNVAMSGGNIAVLEQTLNQRITIRNNQISNYGMDGILAGSNSLVIDGNVFTDAGAWGSNRNHVIYLQGGIEQSPDGYHDERITNNEIHVGGQGQCVGAMVVVHGRRTNTLIQNNLISATSAGGGCYGIQVVDGGYPYACWFRNITIQRNRVNLQAGHNGIAVNDCSNCAITDNVIVQNEAYDAMLGIAMPESTHCSGCDTTTGGIVRNNTVYHPNSTGVVTTYGAIRVGSEGSGYIVEDNAVFTSASSSTCYPISASTTRNSNNYCRGSGGVAASAVFVNAPGGDFRPVVGGPLNATGSSTNYSPTAIGTVSWSATDAGVTRSAPTDLGAMVH